MSGAPSIGYQVPVGSQSDRSSALPVPVGEPVRLHFPSFPITPRRVRLVTWGSIPGLSAVLKIAYPAGTTFNITAAGGAETG